MKKSNAVKNETSGLHIVPSYPTKAPRVRKVVEPIDPSTLTVIESAKLAFSHKHRRAAMIGSVLGAWVPLSAFVVSHTEVDYTQPLYAQIAVWVVVACLGFSMPKVYQWGKNAFHSALAGMCFALLTETLMVVSHNIYLSVAGLIILVGINAVSAAVNLSLQQRKPSYL